MRNMHIMAFILFLFTSCQLGGPPAEVLKAFADKYPGAQEVTWNIDRNGRNEADFTLAGTKYRADFEANGTWVETETNVKWHDLPEATQKAFKNEDKKKDIIEIEFVDNREEGKFYDIEYKISGGKQDIRITPAGTVLGTDRH